MVKISCGIDFGTSNSSIALVDNRAIRLVAVEDAHLTIPSAIFFPPKENTPYFGRTATDLFLSRQQGRYMRSLKRILGTSLLQQGTLINGKVLKFDHIIALFLKNMKEKATASVGEEIEHVVVGPGAFCRQ